MIAIIKRTVYKGLRWLQYLASRRHIYRCEVKGHEIWLDVQSEIDRFRAKTYSTKEPETLEWVERYFSSGDVMYDIGANIGLYSLFAAKRLHSQCKIYAFEPEALNYAQLNKNIHLNQLSGIILPYCLAATNRICFDVFYLNPHGVESFNMGTGLISGSALHSFGTTQDHTGSAFQPLHQQGAVGITLDSLWQEWGLDFPNHIKIDVDGLEEKIIEGATQTLADERLKTVLIEITINQEKEDPILRCLLQNGFVQVMDFLSHSSEQLKNTPYENSVNCIFVRQ